MHEYAIRPHVGVGPILLGKNRGEIGIAMAGLGFTQSAARGDLVSFCHTLKVEFGPDGAADFIGVSQSELYRATYFGVNVFDVTAEEIVTIIASRDDSGPHVFDPDEADEYFPGQVMVLWGPDRQYDRLGNRQRVVWAQVALGSQRYSEGWRYYADR